MTRIPVFVIGGYLGAGKTTFINDCLDRGLRNTAIIVNDFGEINIDASVISARHGDTLELSNGCVCCSIGTSLADTLFAVLDRPVPPETIIIEASGVADPGAVAAYTHLQGLVLAGILVLVDAVEATRTARDPLLRTTFERQVKSAHVIALTKTDIAPAEAVDRAGALVASLNGSATVVSAAAFALGELVVDAPSTPAFEPATDSPSPFASHVHRFGAPPSTAELRDFLASLPRGTVRAKGVVETRDDSRVLVQMTGTHVAITPTTLAPTGLVIITAG